MKKLKNWLEVFKLKVFLWSKEKASSPYAIWWLFIIAFTESSLFLIPPDILLVAILLTGFSRWFHLAFITTLASVLGGIVGYLIGWFLFDSIGSPIINFYGLSEEFSLVGSLFNDNAFWSIFVASFTIIPYKVFTIAAGLFGINIFSFTLASVLGRGLRFLIISYLVYRFGHLFNQMIHRYFNYLSLMIGLLIISLIILSYIF